MDTRDGRIYDESELMKQFKKKTVNDIFGKRFYNLKGDAKFFKPMEIPPTEKQLSRKPPKIGRNEPCPCGSGKKFKRCCLIANWQKRFD